MSRNLFDHYGGLPFISQMVLDFYDRVQDSPNLKAYFAGVDMRRLVEHQAKFMSSLLGGPFSYDDDMLAEVHRHLAIGEDAFSEMIRILDETLAASGME
ncbi:MAG: group 1 truncated hemoglobin, partial [Pseudomonadota bacterium]|nr:group 1 truncated hemoglobin [Pseudomonadota bacterium]